MDVVRLPVVCGPTAAGKSGLALALAERCGLGIISADSRQVYRGFDIGTAKPTAHERSRVPHEGIDLVDPMERYSAAKWVAGVDDWRTSLEERGHAPLVVGGTGLYLRALAEPLFEEPPLDPDARAALQRELQPLPIEELRRRCLALDPARAHLGRTQLLRAIEVTTLAGRPLSVLHREHARPARYTLRYLLVDPGTVLRDWIAQRVDSMLAAGWLDEVARLMASVPPHAPAWNATGYDAIRQVVLGALPLARAREQVIIATRQYAKRQRTWFRNQLPVTDVVHVNSADPGAFERAMAWCAEEKLR